MISLDMKVNLAFFVSILSIVWNVILYRRGQKIERARVYDKVYAASEWMLMYEYNRLSSVEYQSDAKDIEKAVREYSNSHDLACLYGFGYSIPESTGSEELTGSE